MVNRSASTSDSYDVAILGGGLAGLTLALQLKQARPETSVFVAEKRAGPAPDAAFKVGESTSEVGAHYFREVVGLGDHLEREQVRKFGLRFFFTAGDNSDIAKRVEYATPTNLDLYTFQIDRGRFENELVDRCGTAGVDVATGAFIDDVDVAEDGGDARHTVTIVRGGPGGERSTVDARWLVDASGRAGVLKRKLGLEKDNDHVVNSAWFRLAGGLDVEEWSNDDEWLDRMPERGRRKHSTIHLTGEGYWMWMIQLSTGPISIGVCADPRFHPFERFADLDGMIEWLKEHEPQLAAEVDVRRDQVLDYLKIEDFSYNCERVFSTDRWCLTGEAGAFLDPLYSPGSDFIGYGNTFITDLVTRDLEGEDIQNRLEFFNFLYFQLYTPALNLYRDQYQFFGNPQVLMAKLAYNNTAYFSTLTLLFLQGNINRPEVMMPLLPYIERAIPLLARVEGFLREWHALDQREWQGVSVLTKFQPMRDRQVDLVTPMDDETFSASFRRNVELLEALAVTLFHYAARLLPEQPPEDARINPRAISLKPENWESDGLYDESGVSLAEAKEKLPGVDEFFLEEQGAVLADEIAKAPR